MAELALPARRLLGQDVPLHGMTALDLAAGRHLEPLGRGPVGLELPLALLLGFSHGFFSLSPAEPAGGVRGFFSFGSFGSLGSFEAPSPPAAFFPLLAALGGLAGTCSFFGERIWTIVMPS